MYFAHSFSQRLDVNFDLIFVLAMLSVLRAIAHSLFVRLSRTKYMSRSDSKNNS